jgi:hypothetical protein
LAQLVYETTDGDFADQAIQALRDAEISCYRVGHGYTNRQAALSWGAGSEQQVCIYIEHDPDYAEANRILISLGAVVESRPSLRVILGIVLVALIVAISVVVVWNT